MLNGIIIIISSLTYLRGLAAGRLGIFEAMLILSLN